MPLAAVEKTLEILDETDTLERIADYGTRLQEGISGILSGRGIAHVFSGHPSMAGLFFSESVPRNYREWATTDLAGEMNGFLKPTARLFANPLPFDRGDIILEADFRPVIDRHALAAHTLGSERFTETGAAVHPSP